MVLGARVMPDGTPSAALERRVRLGCDLLDQGLTRYLILSGGPTRGPHPESRTMIELAQSLGADPARLIAEPKAMDTIGNAVQCRAIIQERGLRHVGLVTCAFHMPRARFIFTHFGIQAIPFSARPRHPGAEWWLAHAREAAAFLKTLWRLKLCRART